MHQHPLGLTNPNLTWTGRIGEALATPDKLAIYVPDESIEISTCF